jgi:hypothetical protein
MLRKFWLPIIFGIAAIGFAMSAGAQNAVRKTAVPLAVPSPVAIPSVVQTDVDRIARALEAANTRRPSPTEAQQAAENLRAQIRIADWARWMFFVALIEAAVTALGVFLVWKTLQASWRTAKATERMVSDLERPYLFAFSGGQLGTNLAGAEPLLPYTVANHGRSPAIVESLLIGMGPTVSGAPKPEQLVEQDADHSWVIPTGSPLTANASYFGPYEPAAMGNVVPTLGEPDDQLFFHLIVRYRGPFTRGHETSSCWVYHELTNTFEKWGGEEFNYNR